ncbi:MAG TPA: poly(R)-hydroxyalkanoic acid synthase subunit PhaE [Desulfosarcina sp.]|nr:poly(R)-hydroxyalkanoic acid synthase subunit PhaE [Desulfosarcina sp.]
MGEEKKDPFGFETMVEAWTDAVQTFWKSVAGMAPETANEEREETDDTAKATSATWDTMGKALKNWQTMAAAMSAPESVGAIFKGAGAMPEVLLQMVHSAMGGFMELQQKAAESAGRIGASVEAYRFENIDENVFHVWTDIYEKEFRQFFKIPQLGLTRTYQEKLNASVDAYNRFQSTFAEFLRLLAMPFNRSLAVMQEQMSELAEKGEMPEDTRVYYRDWIKVLEGHFMTLFQTPEYVQTLARTITSLTEFSQAKNAVVEDMLRGFPVARQSEVDDLAGEVYALKKRVRQLERMVGRSANRSPGGDP